MIEGRDMMKTYDGQQDAMMRKIPYRTVKGNQDGFTLIELLVATGITVLMISALLMVYVRVIALNEISRDSYLALTAARTQMEQIKNAFQLAKDSEGGEVAYDAVLTTYHGKDFLVDAGDSASGSSSVEKVLDPVGLYAITVSVNWRQNANIELRTLFDSK